MALVAALEVSAELIRAEQVIHPLLVHHKVIMGELRQYQAALEVRLVEAVLVR